MVWVGGGEWWKPILVYSSGPTFELELELDLTWPWPNHVLTLTLTLTLTWPWVGPRVQWDLELENKYFQFRGKRLNWSTSSLALIQPGGKEKIVLGINIFEVIIIEYCELLCNVNFPGRCRGAHWDIVIVSVVDWIYWIGYIMQSWLEHLSGKTQRKSFPRKPIFTFSGWMLRNPIT